jgi:formylglycine-generating enzyme required for sulfatase activity
MAPVPPPPKYLAWQGPLTNSIGVKFVRIEPGTFEMGSPETEGGHGNWEMRHRVKLTKPFLLATTEVTQVQWFRIMATNPSSRDGDHRPVDGVRRLDALEFCKRLTAQEGKQYRLPTEAEWEYACRAGTTTAYSSGDAESTLDEVAWFEKNAGETTHPVARKKANAWGLYDMHGNVWEHVADRWSDLDAEETTDPRGSSISKYYVIKGGGWTSNARMCRAASRGRVEMDSNIVDAGFRVCLDAP